MQPRPGQRPRALARSAARRVGLAVDNVARTYAPENLRVRDDGRTTATLVTPEVRAAADDARAARLKRARVTHVRAGKLAAAFPEVKSGHVDLDGVVVSVPRGGFAAVLTAATREVEDATSAATRPAIEQVRVLRVHQPAPDRFPFPGSCTSPRRAELALEAARRAERVIGPDGIHLTTRGKLERASARAADRAAFSPFKSTGRTSLAGPLVRSNMPREGGGFTPPTAPASPRPVFWSRP